MPEPLFPGRTADFDPCDDDDVTVFSKNWEKSFGRSYEEYQNLKNIDFDLIFNIDGFHGKRFFIENNQIKIAKDFPVDFNYNDIESELIDDALKDEITQEKIREFAVKCPCYKNKKWWQFWK